MVLPRHSTELKKIQNISEENQIHTFLGISLQEFGLGWDCREKALMDRWWNGTEFRDGSGVSVIEWIENGFGIYWSLFHLLLLLLLLLLFLFHLPLSLVMLAIFFFLIFTMGELEMIYIKLSLTGWGKDVQLEAERKGLLGAAVSLRQVGSLIFSFLHA